MARPFTRWHSLSALSARPLRYPLSSESVLLVLWRLTRGYRLSPWRSPYLRWRIETYSGLHADRITFAQFWRFAWTQRRELLRYLRWASRMSAPPAGGAEKK